MAEKPTKAYRVEERWSATSVTIVWAHNADEAKEKHRRGVVNDPDVLVLDNMVGAAPGAIRARRHPSEDRATKGGSKP